jgi:hypothetical protein
MKAGTLYCLNNFIPDSKDKASRKFFPLRLIFAGALWLRAYNFLATRMLASMPLWRYSGFAKPASCIHSATSP